MGIGLGDGRLRGPLAKLSQSTIHASVRRRYADALAIARTRLKFAGKP
jgi:hypothetical protein